MGSVIITEPSNNIVEGKENNKLQSLTTHSSSPNNSILSSDYDGDGDFDTILTHDGYLNMILTDDGVLHFWIGVMRLLDDKPDVEGYNYFPLTSGIWYWNSITETMQIIDPIFDSNNDDGLNDPFAGIGKNRHMYGTVGFTSMVAGAYDELKNRL